MHDGYSKTEVDLKFDNIGLINKNQLDAMRAEMREGFLDMSTRFDTGFKLIDKDINWLKWLTGGTFFLILSIVVAAAIRFLF